MREIIFSSIKGLGETGQPQTIEWNWIFITHMHTKKKKKKLKIDKRLKCMSWNLKPLEENIRENIFSIDFAIIFGYNYKSLSNKSNK